MKFKEVCKLEDKLLKKLGAERLLAMFVQRLEWNVIEDIYVDIYAEITAKEQKKNEIRN